MLSNMSHGPRLAQGCACAVHSPSHAHLHASAWSPRLQRLPLDPSGQTGWGAESVHCAHLPSLLVPSTGPPDLAAAVKHSRQARAPDRVPHCECARRSPALTCVQDMFPSYCGGKCGCANGKGVEAATFPSEGPLGLMAPRGSAEVSRAERPPLPAPPPPTPAKISGAGMAAAAGAGAPCRRVGRLQLPEQLWHAALSCPQELLRVPQGVR